MASASPRDWVTARLQVSAPGARHHVAGQLGPGLGHAQRVEAGEQGGQLRLGQAPEADVLAIGEADVETHLAGDRGQRPELVGGDVTQPGPGHGRDRALGHAPHDVGLDPALVGLGARQGHGSALADGGGGDAAGHPGRGVTQLLDHLGDAAGPARGGQQGVAGAEHASLDLLEAQLVDHPLEAGPQLVVAVAGLLEHAQHRLDGGEQIFLGRERLEGQRRMGVGPQAAGDEHLEALLGGAVVEGAGGGHHADVVEHGLAAVGVAARRS